MRKMNEEMKGKKSIVIVDVVVVCRTPQSKKYSYVCVVRWPKSSLNATTHDETNWNDSILRKNSALLFTATYIRR